MEATRITLPPARIETMQLHRRPWNPARGLRSVAASIAGASDVPSSPWPTRCHSNVPWRTIAKALPWYLQIKSKERCPPPILQRSSYKASLR